MLGLIPKLPLYWAFRTFGWPTVKPFSVVISVSYRCNSKCRTCDVWRKPNDDMTLEERAAVEREVSPADLAIMVHTSGSTADPKGVLHTHGTLVRQTSTWPAAIRAM